VNSPQAHAAHLKHPIRTAAVVGAIGIVYGDIGTSPLYAFKESFRVATQGGVDLQDGVFGVLSLIFWALTITVSIKYLMFILKADNEGEGGVLALITGLRLHKHKGGYKAVLLLIGLSGAAMLFGDGVITPAISVLSAMEGISVVAPSLEHWIVQLTFAVLIGIFMSQRFGTDKIGWVYGPIVLVWFIVLGVMGAHQIIQQPQVLAALNPLYAIDLLRLHPGLAAAIIGSVFLAVTGGEALFADMGHFGRGVIRVSWFTIVMPGLVLNYFGQGALTLSKGGVIENPFFEMAPSWFGIPLLGLATLATIVASQAMITGAFAISRQAIEVGYFPPMRVKGTSERNSQHIFIPRLNMALMFVTLGVVVLFPSSTKLAAAYGIAVAFAMLTTTILFSVWMWEKSNWPKLLVVFFCSIFVALDLAYVTTNLMKVLDGGWLPLLMGASVLTAMLSWHRGIEKLIERHMGYTEPIEDYAARTAGAPLADVQKVGVFFSRTGTMAPVPLERLTNMLHMRFSKVVILSIRISSRPRVEISDRMAVTKIDDHVVKIEIRYGYMQNINIPATIGPALAELGIHTDETLYIIGHERVIVTAEPRSPSDFMNIIFGFLAATAERSVDRFHLPPSRTLEIGYPVRM